MHILDVPWRLERWSENWEVLSIENTYKTNQFNMPLVQVIGVTGVNMAFNVSWALLKEECEESQRWYLDQPRRLTMVRQIRIPFVIICDCDNAFRATRREVFPEAATQLCLWHVMKNVAYRVKLKWHGSLEATELGRRMAARGREKAKGGPVAKDSRGVDRSWDRGRAVGGRRPNARRWLSSTTYCASVSSAGAAPKLPGRTYADNGDAMLQAWKDIVYAPTEGDFNDAWNRLQREFMDQPGRLPRIRDHNRTNAN